MPPAAHPFFATPQGRAMLARERFFDQGERPLGLVSDTVLQSWQRCLQAGHRPDAVPGFDPVSRARRRAAVDGNHALLQAARAECDQLDTLLAGTGCRTLLTDADGVVVRATPAPAGASGVLHAAARVGVSLSEPQVASTAPGISALAGTAVSVHGGEHFYGALQQMHCAAAPIRNARGTVVGVLDLSVEGRPFAFDALSLVRLSAAAIENRWLARQARGALLLCFHARPGLLGTPFEALAAVDGDGTVAWVNAAARWLLGTPDGPLTGTDGPRAEALLGLDAPALERLTRARRPLPHRLPNGLQVMLTVRFGDDGLDTGDEPADPVAGQTATAPAAPLADDAAATASLQALSRQAIEATLARCGGNLSAAARALGVSRGLLYRQLRASAAR